MSKKHKHGSHHQSTNIAELKARVERTRREGKYQQALDLVKHLHRAEPTPAHRELLKDTYLQRAIQLRNQGATRDAITVLEVAAKLDENNPTWLGQISTEMARCGDGTHALALLRQVKQLAGATPQPSVDETRVLASLADVSLVAEKGDKDDKLPPELRADRELIVRAFAQVEAKQDEAARETLAGIGLRSPFLEWKLLLRGLQAYYAKDDERALDNWSRLDPSRVAARLAAPFRATIDSAYRDAQSSATQQILKQQFDWMQGAGIESHLRAFRQALTNRNTLAPAFRALEQLMPHIRQNVPHLVPRLATCLYWMITRFGPDELPRYVRIFGKPTEDPEFDRLSATAMEERGDFEGAHERWLDYEKFIASHPNLWPDEQGKLARALIWLKMGENAATIPTPAQRKKLPRFLRELETFPAPLKPSAQECFERSLELAPNLLGAHEGLFHHLLQSEQEERAITAAERMIKLFPDHVETLEEVADLHTRHNRYAEALTLLEQALKHNPLDRTVREKLSVAHMGVARQLALKEKYDKARQHYRSSLTFSDPEQHVSIWCRWAACEIKAGDQTRADELLTQASEKAPGELFVTYIMLTETNRLKLSNTLKTKLTREFNRGIETTPSPSLALALAGYAASLLASGVKYHGQQTHNKKIIAFAARVDPLQYSEKQLVGLLHQLLLLEAGSRLIHRLCNFGQMQYNHNPWFYYLLAAFMMGDNPDECGPHWQIDRLLQLAEERATKRPPDEPGIKEILEDIKRRRRLIQAFNPFLQGLANLMGSSGNIEDFFEAMSGFGMDLDENDEDDDWE